MDDFKDLCNCGSEHDAYETSVAAILEAFESGCCPYWVFSVTSLLLLNITRVMAYDGETTLDRLREDLDGFLSEGQQEFVEELSSAQEGDRLFPVKQAIMGATVSAAKDQTQH